MMMMILLAVSQVPGHIIDILSLSSVNLHLSQVSFVIKFEFLLLSVKINWLSVITRIKFQFSTLEHNLPECSANILASPDTPG